MNCEYFCKKKSFVADEVEKAQIFFANGDFSRLSGYAEKQKDGSVMIVFGE